MLERKARRKFADRKTKFPNHYIRMKKKSSLLFVSFLALLLAGCTNDLQVPVENAGKALRDASADAVKLVTEFRNEVSPAESTIFNDDNRQIYITGY